MNANTKAEPTQTMKDFFAREDVKAQQEIQKANPYGSKPHRDAFLELLRLADSVGASGLFEDVLQYDSAHIKNVARTFKTTVKQVQASYSKNATELSAMADKAKSKGGTLNGFTEAQLRERASTFEHYSKIEVHP